MSTSSCEVIASSPALRQVRFRRNVEAPKRTAPYNEEPGYYVQGQLWLYGNVRLMDGRLACVERACGPPTHSEDELDLVAREAEDLVLNGKILVCGIHNPAHQRAAVVPLRWGSPRVLILSGGFYFHLGEYLKEEPFRAARLWRYQFDKHTDLVVSRRPPCRKPTFARHNPTIDRLIVMFALRQWPGLARPFGLCGLCEACAT
jgi:hypothetical protein